MSGVKNFAPFFLCSAVGFKRKFIRNNIFKKVVLSANYEDFTKLSSTFFFLEGGLTTKRW
jgi:hypothetical protein